MVYYGCALTDKGGATVNSAQNSISEKRTYTVEEIAEILSIGKAAAYGLVKSGCFHIVKIGKAIRISKRSFDSWLDRDIS